MNDVIVCGFWINRNPCVSAVRARCSHCPEEITVVDRLLLGAGELVCPGCFLRMADDIKLRCDDARTINIALGVAEFLVKQHKRALAIAAG
jgi:hypothetical protein